MTAEQIQATYPNGVPLEHMVERSLNVADECVRDMDRFFKALDSLSLVGPQRKIVTALMGLAYARGCSDAHFLHAHGVDLSSLNELDQTKYNACIERMYPKGVTIKP